MADTSWQEQPTWRPLAIGRRGAVASGHPLATLAGLDALRRGGNAADAAVATAAALAVVEPQMSGVGGDGFFLFWDATARRGTVVNATGPAPREATPERFPSGIPGFGALTASTPGLVAGWWALWQRFGTRPWPELLQPAIALASDGFGTTRSFAGCIRDEAALLARDPDAARVFLPDGVPPRLGTPIRQPELARTLEELAQDGAESLYGGALGRRLVAATRAKGGLLSLEDLAAFEPELQEPIGTTYRGYQVLQSPPNSTGFTLLQELNLAEQFPLAELGLLSADTIHLLVEIKKLAFLDRERCGDPRFGSLDLAELLSKEYAARLAVQIDPRRAAERPLAAEATGGDTTYFAVVDGQGNAVSGIQSINSIFGAKVIAGETGILLNDRMRYWHLRPGHPNRLAPGKRVRHTMNTPLVLKDGRLVAMLGTPGADGQVQVNLQVATFLLDFGLDPQQAVEAPRWRHYQQGADANWPHTALERLTVESRFPPQVLAELELRGHRLERVGPLEAGCNAQVILVDAGSGWLLAGADPRRDAWALAF